MEIIKQVCGLELSKKLKGLGCKQESLFYWTRPFDGKRHYKHILDYKESMCWDEDCKHNPISAFTVAELGEMLNEYIFFEGRTIGNKWLFSFGDQQAVYGETEVEARAKMLIYLLENKLIPDKQESEEL